MSTDNADRYPHLPLSKRDPADHLAALSAFQRLYLYANQSGKTALAIFAVYKALQKLEESTLQQEGDGEDTRAPPSTIAIPAWVRSGLWLAFKTYLVSPSQPGVTDKKRPIRFTQALTDDWDIVRRWCLVSSFMLEHGAKRHRAAQHHASPGAAKDALLRAYDDIEELFSEANNQNLLDEHGKPLAYIESRDLVPTQKLLSIFQSN
jgi:hypothetical protein